MEGIIMYRTILAALGLAFVLPAAATAATTDPEIIIYRFAGVIASNGTGTVFLCTNFSGATETIRFVTRQTDTSIMHNQTVTINHLATVAVATRSVSAYTVQTLLNPPNGFQGTAAIAATSTNIIWSALNIDAANAASVGVALHGVRFNALSGSEE